MAREAKFEIDFYGKSREEFCTRLVAPNGEILTASGGEGFVAKQNAKKNIERIIKYAATAKIVDLTK